MVNIRENIQKIAGIKLLNIDNEKNISSKIFRVIRKMTNSVALYSTSKTLNIKLLIYRKKFKDFSLR